MWKAAKIVLRMFALILAISLVFVNTVTIGMLNAEREDQNRLNQQLIHMVNKHEKYMAMHHCTLFFLLQLEGLIPQDAELDCKPEFIEVPGYSLFPNCPKIEVPETKSEEPPVNKLLPLEKMDYV